MGTLLGCSTCTLAQFELLDDVAPASLPPTILKPTTASPTQPTASPTIPTASPTLKPTASPTQPTASPTLKPSASPSASPATEGTSSVSALTPAHAFLVVLVGAAALV